MKMTSFKGVKSLQGPLRVLNSLRGQRLGVSIQGGTLRLALAQGQRLLNWAYIPLNPAFLRKGFVADRQGVSTVLENVLLSRGFPPAPVAAVLPGLESIVWTMRLPNQREVRPAEVLPREARRLVAFDEKSQYLFWRLAARDDKVQTFVAMAVPKDAIRGLVETLRLARLAPGRVELAPFCLARNLPEARAIAANVETTGVDIVVVVDSVPAMVRCLWFEGETLSVEEVAERVAEEMMNTLNAYNASAPDSPLPLSLPIYLAGGVSLEDLTPAIASGTGHPIRPLLPRQKTPEGFPASAMAVVGGLLADK